MAECGEKRTPTWEVYSPSATSIVAFINGAGGGRDRTPAIGRQGRYERRAPFG